VLVQELAQVGIGIDDADQIASHRDSVHDDDDHEHEHDNDEPDARERPRLAPELGFRAVTGVVALGGLADPIVIVVKARHAELTTRTTG
jgi:hypothetical protein